MYHFLIVCVLQTKSLYISRVVRHRLRTPWEEIVFTARLKIHSHSQIFRYGQSIFCLPHRPNFSDIFDLCLHWVSVVRVVSYLTMECVFFKPISNLYLNCQAKVYGFLFTTFKCGCYNIKKKCPWKHKKVAFKSSIFPAQPSQNQPKSHIIFRRNGSLRDLYIMTFKWTLVLLALQK